MSDVIGPFSSRNDPRRFGRMVVIATDQFAGRRYRCPCGWVGWSVWGHAIRHARTCPQALEPER